MSINNVDQLLAYLNKDGEVQTENATHVPNPTSTVATSNYSDPGIDTKAEARALQERLQNFDRELSTLPADSHRHRVVKLQRDSLARAIPHELARYREIDRQRAVTAEMARTGLNKRSR